MIFQKQINIIYRAKELVEQHERDEAKTRFQVKARALRGCYQILEENRK